MATESKRIRDYAKEYLIRIARGLAGGKSRSQARGHARAADLPSNAARQPFKRSEPLEDALKLMKKGVSQKEAAKQAGVSAETLRRFQKGQHDFPQERPPLAHLDTRPVSVVMATRGKMRPVTVSHDATQRHQPPLDRDQSVPGDQQSVASCGLRRQGTAGQQRRVPPLRDPPQCLAQAR